MPSSLLYRVSKELGIDSSVLEKEALLRYLRDELRRVRLEAKLIMSKYQA